MYKDHSTRNMYGKTSETGAAYESSSQILHKGGNTKRLADAVAEAIGVRAEDKSHLDLESSRTLQEI